MFISAFICTVFINAITMSVPIYCFKRSPSCLDNYILDFNNYIDYQNGNECAAFATAYILRYFNINADGNSLYKDFPCKFPSGGITPLGIRKVFKKYGFKTKYYKGNMNSLKAELEKGLPVIVNVHSTPKTKARHFVPVTGYDQDGFYLAESLENLRNTSNDEGIYNRKVPFREFKKMWNIKTIYMPLYSYTYITVIPK
jgi:ABC-type bacteriocin/lantibiotic exporter with double-glycine peptidase domain